jgi:hypothetical protein
MFHRFLQDPVPKTDDPLTIVLVSSEVRKLMGPQYALNGPSMFPE